MHFAVIHGRWTIDAVGEPVPVFDCQGVGDRAQPCRVHIYKRRDAVPQRYYEALGRSKPEARPDRR